LDLQKFVIDLKTFSGFAVKFVSSLIRNNQWNAQSGCFTEMDCQMLSKGLEKALSEPIMMISKEKNFFDPGDEKIEPSFEIFCQNCNLPRAAVNFKRNRSVSPEIQIEDGGNNSYYNFQDFNSKKTLAKRASILSPKKKWSQSQYYRDKIRKISVPHNWEVYSPEKSKPARDMMHSGSDLNLYHPISPRVENSYTATDVASLSILNKNNTPAHKTSPMLEPADLVRSVFSTSNNPEPQIPPSTNPALAPTPNQPYRLIKVPQSKKLSQAHLSSFNRV
jgi:hypothetical protein